MKKLLFLIGCLVVCFSSYAITDTSGFLPFFEYFPNNDNAETTEIVMYLNKFNLVSSYENDFGTSFYEYAPSFYCVYKSPTGVEYQIARITIAFYNEKLLSTTFSLASFDTSFGWLIDCFKDYDILDTSMLTFYNPEESFNYSFEFFPPVIHGTLNVPVYCIDLLVTRKFAW
jgi:hypothetical protein